MYHVHGTHVTPDMNAEQADRARRWELPATVVALLIVPYLLLNHYSDGDSAWNTVVDVLYVGIWTFFVVEAVAMLIIAPDNPNWFRRNTLDIAIIALTAPFEFLPDGFEVLQTLWLLRILDLLPVVHRNLFSISVLRFAVIVWGIIVLGGALAYYKLEQDIEGGPANLFDAIYWANTVVSTVGFGDYLPHIWQTKLLAIFLQLCGPVIAAILVAGILPMFDEDFARGFSQKVAEKVAEVADDVADIEQDIDEIEQGERAQDRVLAQNARRLDEIIRRLDERDAGNTGELAGSRRATPADDA